MTRAKNALTIIHPLRFYIRQQSRFGDRHVFTPRSRFLPDALLPLFDRGDPDESDHDVAAPGPQPVGPRVDVAARLRATWR